MSNYENDTAFFDTVNNHAMEVTAREVQAANAERYFPYIERAVKRSIDIADVKAEDYRRQMARAAYLEKLRKLRIVALIIAGVITFGGLTYAGKKLPQIKDIKVATSFATVDAQNKLIELMLFKQGGSIAFSDEKVYYDMIQSLETSDFSKLSVNNLGEVYSYRLVLGDQKFEEFVKSLTYLENGEERNYISFEQFLNINGFGSEKEFVNKAEAILLEEYGNEHHKSKGGI